MHRLCVVNTFACVGITNHALVCNTDSYGVFSNLQNFTFHWTISKRAVDSMHRNPDQMTFRINVHAQRHNRIVCVFWDQFKKKFELGTEKPKGSEKPSEEGNGKDRLRGIRDSHSKEEVASRSIKSKTIDGNEIRADGDYWLIAWIIAWHSS